RRRAARDALRLRCRRRRHPARRRRASPRRPPARGRAADARAPAARAHVRLDGAHARMLRGAGADLTEGLMTTVKGGRSALVLATALVLGIASGSRAHDWNDAQVAWKDYEAGLAAAKKEKKPICLVFYTEWCPHCANYSHVFHDPKVVEKSKELVMVRLDKDKNAELSKQYAPDGEYIPRTF